jgi:hypothetical protein
MDTKKTGIIALAIVPPALATFVLAKLIRLKHGG